MLKNLIGPIDLQTHVTADIYRHVVEYRFKCLDAPYTPRLNYGVRRFLYLVVKNHEVVVGPY